MRTVSIAVLLGLSMLAAVGCQPKTVAAEDFLFAFRSGHLPDEKSSQKSTYEGKRGEFHCLKIAPARGTSDPLDQLDVQTVRCPADELPSDFPEGFKQAASSDESFEAGDDTWQYVRDYLANNHASIKHPPKTDKPGTYSEQSTD